MKKWKDLAKRGTAFLLSLLMCMSLMQVPAFAALISGEKFTVEVVKVVNGNRVDSKTLTVKCLQSTGHSGYNHSTNLRTLANQSGFSGYKGYNWNQYTTVPSSYTKGLAPNNNYASVHYNITGSAPYKANETLFLFFEANQTFTLKYSANGGSGAPDTQTATSTASSYDFTISDKQPSREGYKFLGWNTSSAATSPDYHSGDIINVTGTTTLYAVWEKETSTAADYRVEWYDTEGEPLKTPETRTGTVGETVSVTDEDKVIDGYTFDAENLGNILSAALSAGDNVLRLYFTKDEEKVEANYRVEWYDTEGEPLKTPETRTGTVGETASVTDEDKVIDGYTFDAENSGNILSATLFESGTVLRLYFTKDQVVPKEYTLTVKCIDEDGNELKSASEIKQEGAEYTVEPGKIDGYEYSKPADDSDQLNGEMDSDKTVILIYKKNDSPDKPVDPEKKEAEYKVGWYDADTEEEIREPEDRKGEVGKSVTVKDSDKFIDGYTYKADDPRNIESVVLDENTPELKLYFTKNKDTEPEKPPVRPEEPEKPEEREEKILYRILYYKNYSGESDEEPWRKERQEIVITVKATASDAEREAERQEKIESVIESLLHIIDEEPTRKGYSFDSWGVERYDEMSSGYGPGDVAPWQEAKRVDETTYELSLYAYWEADDPDDPNKPETPDTPDDPNKPETPDDPDDPNKPENPDAPDGPNKPENPDDPGDPDKPETPDTPDDPNQPENPEIPDIPDTPNTPGATPGGYSGGSGGSGGSRRTGDTTGGPGTIQLNEGEVPLASLPEPAENQLTQIDDGDVPLAGLPKTGQGTSAAKMMLFLSGAMLAVYASLFRKEEEE